MKERHLALIVEDDSATAADLTEILKSLDCDSMVANNKKDALALLAGNTFCFVLLDLQIKGDADSIKGHTEHGHSLLRAIRKANLDHPECSYWLPILIVSGFAREADAAVDVMKDGASDVIQKPLKGRNVSEAIHRELVKSGRLSHDLCGSKPKRRSPRTGKGVTLAIPGDRDRRRIRIAVNEIPIPLPEKSLKVLLHLMVAHVTGALVHKRTLGAKGDQGLKDISRLRQELKPALEDGVEIIKTDYHGNFSLTENVTIGNCDVDKLTSIGDRQISALAAQLRNELEARQPEPEGTP